MLSPFFTTHPPLPKMDHTAGHKHSQYHPTIGRVICTLIEAGLTVRQVAAHRDMPSYCTFFQWRKMNPDFDDLYRTIRGRAPTFGGAGRNGLRGLKPTSLGARQPPPALRATCPEGEEWGGMGRI